MRSHVFPIWCKNGKNGKNFNSVFLLKLFLIPLYVKIDSFKLGYKLKINMHRKFPFFLFLTASTSIVFSSEEDEFKFT